MPFLALFVLASLFQPNEASSRAASVSSELQMHKAQMKASMTFQRAVHIMETSARAPREVLAMIQENLGNNKKNHHHKKLQTKKLRRYASTLQVQTGPPGALGNSQSVYNGGVWGALHKINDMLLETVEKADLEEIRCDSYKRTSEVLMEEIKEDLATYVVLVTSSTSDKNDAESNIEKHKEEADKVEEEIVKFTTQINAELSSLNTQLKVAQVAASAHATFMCLALLAWTSCGWRMQSSRDFSDLDSLRLASRFEPSIDTACCNCSTTGKFLAALLLAHPGVTVQRAGLRSNRFASARAEIGRSVSANMNAEIATADLGSDLDVLEAKTRLGDIVGTRPDATLVDPTSKSVLQRQVTVIGSTARQVLVSSSGEKYPVRRVGRDTVYADLLPRETVDLGKLGSQIADELFSVLSVQTGLFRGPLVPFLYERGWRQQFKNAGFPGIDKEFAEVTEYFTPANGGTVVDLSCGSGLMTRRLVKSGKYGRVLAMDYSEDMLKETNRRLTGESIPKDSLTLVRADAAELPLRTGSIDALHAGAAMHCWPRLAMSLAEIRRSLKPGGLFFATTFFAGAYGGPPIQLQQSTNSFYFFKDEKELEDLLSEAGFSKFNVRREGRGCAIIRAEA
jgi:SAM-dependent methyltransferase